MALNFYHPRMRVGNVFSHVCVYLSVCLSVCLSICSGYNFWTASHRDFIFGMQVPIYHIKVKFEYQGHWVRLYEKNDNFTYFNMSILCIWLQVIEEVKVTH